MSGLRSELVTTPEGFCALREDWTRLHERGTRPTIFLTWDWLHAWWLHFGTGQSLRLVIVRDPDGAIVGIGPFCIERSEGLWSVRTLKFMGTKRVSSDYLDLLAAPGREADVAAAIFRVLREDASSWDLAELGDALDDSITLRHLEKEAAQSQCWTERSVAYRCPYLPLPDSQEGYLASIGRTKRSRVKRARQSFDGIGARWVVATTEEALRPALETLFELHQRGWAARGRPGNFGDEPVRRFHKSLTESLGRSGRMRVYALEREGRALACDYLFQQGSIVHFYQAGFDPTPPVPDLPHYNPGYALLSHVIEDSVRHGAHEFDFLRGDDEYKMRWTDLVRTTYRLMIIPKNRRGAMARLRSEQGIRWAKRTARSWLPHSKAK